MTIGNLFDNLKSFLDADPEMRDAEIKFVDARNLVNKLTQQSWKRIIFRVKVDEKFSKNRRGFIKIDPDRVEFEAAPERVVKVVEVKDGEKECSDTEHI